MGGTRDTRWATGRRSRGCAGRLREAEQLTKSTISIMRRIDQQWGVARALLGLGDLARLRGDPGGAHSRYLEALAILRDIDARPDMARCLAGLARVAMDLGSMGQARQHLAESIRLSHSTGSRIGVARGLEAFASLAVREDRPELAVQLTAAATALREAAGYPALDGARRERYLAPARRLLGKPAVERLWAQGRALSGEAAVALALDEPQPASGDAVTLAVVGDYEVASGAARHTDAAGTPGRSAGRGWPQQQVHCGGALHQPGDGRPARCQHPGQAWVLLARADRRLGRGQPARSR